MLTIFFTVIVENAVLNLSFDNVSTDNEIVYDSAISSYIVNKKI